MVFATASFAQKPTEGSLLTEARFNIASNQANFDLPSLRLRYFIAEDMALRLDLGVNGKKTTAYVVDPTDEKNTGSNELKTSGFTLGLGVEKHFSGNERFSPYMSAGLGYLTSKGTATWTDYNSGSYQKDSKADINSSQSNTLGFNLGFGADYWIGKSFYLGAEFGFGFNSTKRPELTSTYDDGTTKREVKSQEIKSSGFETSTLTGGSFRIGFALK